MKAREGKENTFIHTFILAFNAAKTQGMLITCAVAVVEDIFVNQPIHALIVGIYQTSTRPD